MNEFESLKIGDAVKVKVFVDASSSGQIVGDGTAIVKALIPEHKRFVAEQHYKAELTRRGKVIGECLVEGDFEFQFFGGYWQLMCRHGK